MSVNWGSFPNKIHAVLGSAWNGLGNGLDTGMNFIMKKTTDKGGGYNSWSEDGTNTPNYLSNRLRLSFFEYHYGGFFYQAGINMDVCYAYQDQWIGTATPYFSGWVTAPPTQPGVPGNIRGGGAGSPGSPTSVTWGTVYSWLDFWGNTTASFGFGVFYLASLSSPANRSQVFSTWEIYIDPPPSKPTTPDPTHGAIEVPVDQVLSWVNGGGADTYDVYFGTNPDPSGDFKGNQPGLTYDPPGNLDQATKYYWRIDAKNDGGTTTGDVWSFDTVVGRGPDKTTFRYG